MPPTLVDYGFHATSHFGRFAGTLLPSRRTAQKASRLSSSCYPPSLTYRRLDRPISVSSRTSGPTTPSLPLTPLQTSWLFPLGPTRTSALNFPTCTGALFSIGPYRFFPPLRVGVSLFTSVFRGSTPGQGVLWKPRLWKTPWCSSGRLFSPPVFGFVCFSGFGRLPTRRGFVCMTADSSSHRTERLPLLFFLSLSRSLIMRPRAERNLGSSESEIHVLRLIDMCFSWLRLNLRSLPPLYPSRQTPPPPK